MKWIMILAGALTAISSAGQAETTSADTDVVTKSVQYAELELGSAEGRQELERRIRAAARDVCGGRIESAVSRGPNRHQCYNQALTDGLQQMGRVVARHSAEPVVASASPLPQRP